jgi:peptidoglycan-N-acetylglucosamine deacetylase
MNPDNEAGERASLLIKTTILTIVFSFTHCYKTETKRTMPVLPPKHNNELSAVNKKITPKKKKPKTIYLTFDDGPNKGTINVMHIAYEESIPISMFFVGEHVYGSKAQENTYDSVEHCCFVEIENHSYTHANHNNYESFYNDPSVVISDFKRCADSLKLSSNIIRTPGRNIWRTDSINVTDIKKSTAAADSLQKNGYTAVGWDLEWHFDNKLELETQMTNCCRRLTVYFQKGKPKLRTI